MTKLLLKFHLILENHQTSSLSRHYGLIFHRWLPNGETDAIELFLDDPTAKLKIWFTRRGFVHEDGFIRFDYERFETSDEIIQKQGCIEGGPLFGLLEINECSEEIIRVIQDKKIDGPIYQKFGKKVIKEYLQPPLSRFLKILQYNYGQYWILSLNEWDSRDCSLGSYCHSMLLQWSLDDGRTWTDFLPSRLSICISSPILRGSYFKNYITKDDWQRLIQINRNKYSPSTGIMLLAKAHELLDNGDIKYAFIESVSALEILIYDYLRKSIQSDQFLSDKILPFIDSNLPNKLIVTLSLISSCSVDDKKNAIFVIDIRNKIVHEGYEPKTEDKQKLIQFFNIFPNLLINLPLKFPSANAGNALMDSETWDREYLEHS